MTSKLVAVRSSNLSYAWGRAFLSLLDHGASDLIPLVVNISEFDNGSPPEDAAIRTALDGFLRTDDRFCVSATTADLIFPENVWRRHRQEGRDAFFERYRKVLYPRLKAADERNSRGTYFLRTIQYGPNGIDQLKHILDSRLGGNNRRSALQVMVFDPTKDHSDQPFLKFPCLDYIAFTPDSTDGLSLTAFYANHYILARAYGNYLGLCALGRFVAAELSLRFRQLTCVAGVAQLGDVTKSDVRELGDAVRHALPPGAAGLLPGLRSSN